MPYRGAYEAAVEQKDGNVQRVQETIRTVEAMRGGQ